MSRVFLKVCPIHGPVSLNALTCPRPVSAGDKNDPQATNPCAQKLRRREFEMVDTPERPSEDK